MAPIIPIFTAIGGALTAGAATGTAAAVIGGAATALTVGGVAAGTAAVAHSAGKASGAKKAARELLSDQSVGNSATANGDGETGTAARRSLAMSSTSSSGVLGNATVGRRQLLAT